MGAYNEQGLPSATRGPAATSEFNRRQYQQRHKEFTGVSDTDPTNMTHARSTFWDKNPTFAKKLSEALGSLLQGTGSLPGGLLAAKNRIYHRRIQLVQ